MRDTEVWVGNARERRKIFSILWDSCTGTQDYQSFLYEKWSSSKFISIQREWWYSSEKELRSGFDFVMVNEYFHWQKWNKGTNIKSHFLFRWHFPYTFCFDSLHVSSCHVPAIWSCSPNPQVSESISSVQYWFINSTIKDRITIYSAWLCMLSWR